MTAEDKCRAYQELLSWAKYSSDDVMYLEERLYAVRLDPDMVAIVKADNLKQAEIKAKARNIHIENSEVTFNL